MLGLGRRSYANHKQDVLHLDPMSMEAIVVSCPQEACTLALTYTQAAAQDCDVLLQQSLYVFVCIFFSLQDFQHSYSIQRVSF